MVYHDGIFASTPSSPVSFHFHDRDHRLVPPSSARIPSRTLESPRGASASPTAMPISSTLAARIGTDPAPAPAPAPARWSPYTRSSESDSAPRDGGGGAKAARCSPLRLDPATTRLLGPAQRSAPAPPGSRHRAEAATPDAAAAPALRRRRCETTILKAEPKRALEDEKNPFDVECPRRGDGGGFVFLCALAGHTEAISGISLPLGSDKLYSGSVDGSVRIWDCKSGKAWNTQTGMKLSLHGPSGLVCSMTVTNEMLFAGTGDGRIMAWKFPSKESNVEPMAILGGHERPVISLSISATRLYSSSLDKTINVWDLKTLQCVQTLSEHKAAVTSVLCWDQKLLSCSLDKTVKVWGLSESGSLQVEYTHDEEHGLRTLLGVHRVGKTPVLLCSLHNSNCVHLLDLPSFDEVGKLSSKKEVRTMELAAGGPLFTGDCAGELKVWRWAPQD